MRPANRVSGIQTASPSLDCRGNAEGEPRASPEPGRSLVLITPPPSPGEERTPHFAQRHAPFLAHLIAMRDQAPQLRQRRRAGTADAILSYIAAGTADPPRGHHAVNRFV